MFRAKSGLLREEAKRKAIHICGTAIPVGYLILPKDVIIIGFVLAFLVIGAIEWLRFHGIIALPFLRKNEGKQIGAYVFFFIGAFLSIVLFEKSIAIAAIFMLAVGDAASALAGAVVNGDKKEWYEKRLKHPKVMLVMFVISGIIGWLVLHSLPVAVLGAIGATIADSVPLQVHKSQIDDNLTIPLFAGALMSFGLMG